MSEFRDIPDHDRLCAVESHLAALAAAHQHLKDILERRLAAVAPDTDEQRLHDMEARLESLGGRTKTLETRLDRFMTAWWRR